MHVCIVGAGIVGLACLCAAARGLPRHGPGARPGPAAGASGGNGAQLSYSYVRPLADPGIWKMLPQLLLEKDSPLACACAPTRPRAWGRARAPAMHAPPCTARGAAEAGRRSRQAFEGLQAQSP
jgi:D-amino-acid dehydrogenase